MTGQSTASDSDASPRKRDETLTFLFLAVFLAPLLSIIIVGGYGFLVWMHHLIYGPPAA